jgi:hypothetical protein
MGIRARHRVRVGRWNHKKSYQNMDFHSLWRLFKEYNSLWPPKCGGGSESLIRKGFQDNVEAHESTCDTWPAS